VASGFSRPMQEMLATVSGLSCFKWNVFIFVIICNYTIFYFIFVAFYNWQSFCIIPAQLYRKFKPMLPSRRFV